MNKEILMVIETVSNEKNVSKEVIIDAIEHALASSVKKKYRLDRKCEFDIDARVSIDLDTGEYTTYRRWQIVEEIEEEMSDQQIILEDAKVKSKDLEIDDYYEEEIDSIEFSRIVAMAAKNVIVQKVREAERNRVVDMYQSKIGQLIFGIVKRIEKGNVYMDLGMPDKQNSMEEAMIMKDALIPREAIRPGDRLRGYLRDVQSELRGPQLYITRKAPEFLVELFKLEVPEVGQGLIEILGAARDPGLRAKISVKSNDPKLDAIGACVGMRGSRVQSVSNELSGERIDIIMWDEDPAKFVINAMSPAEVLSIVVDEEKKSMDIAVAEEQLSQAIGRGGQNVRLASELTGWDLNVMSKDDSDNKIMEENQSLSAIFMDELNVDEDVADVLAREGFSSIDEVAYCSMDEFSSIDDFDEDLINELRKRAIEKIEAKKEKLDQENSLSNFKILSKDNINKLISNDINNREDLADLSVDELLEMIELSQEDAGKVIMDAREPWFNQD
ncbi:MAG: transcription termination/antitermination protein NusA [Gammaproteobacteria bacterium]|jgi:transcription termination/antitermination protein NusA|nr:transcription termination/antitermination protein NusA [Gammaproteobacteria bacterium]MBT4462964.1 transcription termination/antitermination protein NusA [Gammaproteobacteria bacterium]MBT5117076.1 transcription termination/antitermination protein NusA [Gammaproteobacteria bacterium]MBT6331865.1 transcription termination/antitermination protein NusA [Gammaproteobacteria bacterium]MBT7932942.1 transcription termination/antitermination protein NusA [Gammaproteobacteria bacterium]